MRPLKTYCIFEISIKSTLIKRKEKASKIDARNKRTDTNKSYQSVAIIHKLPFPQWPPHLRGPTPSEDMIFYLWTDSNEICKAYVKLNSKHILFIRIFLFSI